MKAGDYILAINGQPTNKVADISLLLIGTAGKQTELTTNSKPELTGSKKTLMIPIADERHLYYYNWVQLVPRARSQVQPAQQVRKVFKVKPARLERKDRKAFKA